MRIGESEMKTTQLEPRGFFTLGQQQGHWWLITPSGRPFFTLGINHIDPATLHYPENIDIWRDRYGGSTIRWIKESVVPHLRLWGFNSVGERKSIGAFTRLGMEVRSANKGWLMVASAIPCKREAFAVGTVWIAANSVVG